MKQLSVALQAHLDSGTTTMVYCWRVTRRDSVVQGFTEHDRDLFCDGTLFEASSGFTASQIQQSLGLSVDNLNVDGALSTDTLNEDDLAAGKYDDAFVELLWVNWQDTTQFLLVSTGSVGEVKRMGKAFSAELRSLTHRLNQKQGRQYQRTCDAVLGDARCGVNLNTGAFKGTGVVAAALAARSIAASGLGAFADDWFTNGVLTWTSGPNSGVSYDVKDHVKDGSGNVVIELWVPPAFTLTNGWTFTITAGCKQNMEACRDKFNNLVNFQGFPHMPGNDVLTKYPEQGGSNQTGSSVVGS